MLTLTAAVAAAKSDDKKMHTIFSWNYSESKLSSSISLRVWILSNVDKTE